MIIVQQSHIPTKYQMASHKQQSHTTRNKTRILFIFFFSSIFLFKNKMSQQSLKSGLRENWNDPNMPQKKRWSCEISKSSLDQSDFQAWSKWTKISRASPGRKGDSILLELTLTNDLTLIMNTQITKTCTMEWREASMITNFPDEKGNL